ncbi:MAG: thiamine ABC transporter substrate-binding protein [Ardenticatenaceae bacterium]
MNTSIRWLAVSMLFVLLLVACGPPEAGSGPAAPEAPAEPAAESDEAGEASEAGEAAEASEAAEVRLVTHESFYLSEGVLEAFEEANNAKVVLVQLGDAGSMVNQSILSANNPLGDVMFGVDNTFLTRALNEDLFEPYESANLSNVSDSFKVDPENRVTPIDYGDVCLNYDKAYFEEAGIAPPASLEDLTKPEYKELTVTENPASSSPGLAFLLATVAHFGEDGWEQYWTDLRDNGLLVTDGWSDAYFGHFTAGSEDGTRPIVVSYASSPAASEGGTASVLADGSCFRQIEFAGVLKNGNNPELAQALIDFMLTPTFQEDVPGNMYVFPVIKGANLPDAFTQYAQVPDVPAEVDLAFIEENRESLIESWSEVVLR